MAIDPRFMEELKAKNNIAEVASSYVALDRKGGNYWACCPFHHERTPSFAINESEQFYHCFGCGVSGDVVRFVQEMESTDFMGAVRILAARAKMAIPEDGFDDEQAKQTKKKRDTLSKILLETARFYLSNLYSGDERADKHLQYIQKRSLTPTTVKKFGLGASLDFNSLPRYLFDLGFSKEDCLASGVLAQKEGKPYDALGGRLIFPIINAMDEVVAFGGRNLEKTDFAKYKNTEETMLFNKRNVLYNINQLKKLKREQAISSVIMVEGYMDTISLYQAGFKNVVASMGTALTKEHAKLLKRYSENIYFSYDGDFAGQKNTLRGLGILEQEQLTVKVVPLPEGQDPDDVVKQGQEAYQKCLDAAMPLIDYRILYAERNYDLSKTVDKRKFIEEALKIIRSEDSESVREELLKKLRDRTGVSYQSLERDMQNLPQETNEETEGAEMRFSSEAARDSISYKAARFILVAKLFSEPYARKLDWSSIDFENEIHMDIRNYLISCEKEGKAPQPGSLFSIFGTEEQEFNKILDLQLELETPSAEKFFLDSVKVLQREQIERHLPILTEAYKAETDVEQRKKIARELNELILRSKGLK
jgi:DNA primase